MIQIRMVTIAVLFSLNVNNPFNQGAFMKNSVLVSLCAGLLASSLSTQAATYELDLSHSSIGFAVRHMVVSKTKGTFDEYTGSITLDADNKLASAETVIKASSINTRDKKRDDHLRNPDFFEVEKFDAITFKTTKIGEKTLTGDLTMRGITKSVELTYELNGPITNPWGKKIIGLEAAGKINRKDFGLTWNKAIESGGLAVGEEVELIINLEAILKS